jgi:hypothetical protein
LQNDKKTNIKNYIFDFQLPTIFNYEDFNQKSTKESKHRQKTGTVLRQIITQPGGLPRLITFH